MSSIFSSDAPYFKDLRIGTLFGEMSPDYRESVVKNALASRECVSSALRTLLNKSIDDNVKAPRGFRTASGAPLPSIIPSILRQLHISDALVTVVLRVWASSHGDLRNIVVEHLDAIGVAAKYPDFQARRFRSHQPSRDWLQARDAIVQTHSGLDEKDVSLMLCYVSGTVPTTAQSSRQEEVETVHSNVLSQAIQYLRNLPAESSEWEKEVPDFQESIRCLADEKKAERYEIQRLELRSAIADLKNHPEVAYFELDLHSWSVPNDIALTEVSESLSLLEKLESAFERYASIPPRGAVRSETLAYDDQRKGVEEEIHSIKSDLDQILTTEDRPDDKPPVPDPVSIETETVAPVAAEVETVSDEAESPIEESVPDSTPMEAELDASVAAEAETVLDTANPPSDESVPDSASIEPKAAEFIAAEVETGSDIAESLPDELGSHGKDNQTIDHHEILWFLVGKDDLAGAYWIARSLEERDITPPIPSWLLKAVQGARWLSPYSDRYVVDLAEIVSQTEPPTGDDAQILLGLAASLIPSITAPGANMLGWLSSSHPDIEKVVSPLRDFANLGSSIRPEDVRGDEAKQRLDYRIAEASANAKTWLNESRRHHHKLPRANNVWRYLLTNEGTVIQMLTPVVNDDRQKINTVRTMIMSLNQEATATDVINPIDRRLLTESGKTPRTDITGAARSWLLRRIDEAVGEAERWCIRVEQELETHQISKDNWLLDQISRLRDRVESASPDAFKTLSDLTIAPNPPDIAAAAQCAMRSLKYLLDYLNIPFDPPIVVPAPSLADALAKVNGSDYAAPGDDGELGGLDIAIAGRLMWIPSVILDDSGLPTSNTVASLTLEPSDLLSADTVLQDVIKNRLEVDDFRFFDYLAPALPPDHLSELRERHSRGLDEARRTLKDHIQESQEAVDRAAHDAVIEFEGEEWDGLHGRINDINHDEELNIRECHDVLDRVKDEIENLRNLRRKELASEWHETLNDFDNTHYDSDTMTTLRKRFEDARNFDPPDIRVMEDCITLARDHRSGASLGSIAIHGNEFRKTLEKFIDFQNSIDDSKRRDGQWS